MTTISAEAEKASEISAWSPLRVSSFRALWTAGAIANTGTWMQTVGAAWMMTLMNASPSLVALVQTAGALPFFLFALLAGALADVVDRRKLLLVTQIGSLLLAAALGVLTVFGLVSPATLLIFTFLIGLGAALATPALQAATPELVPREQLAPAVALSSVSINLARAVGPALGGFIVAGLGVAAAFFANAASFLPIIGFLWRWQPAEKEHGLPPEHFFGAMRAGVRYSLNAPEFQAVLIRNAAFIVGGSALWALLPLRAQRDLGFSAIGYGALLGAIGAGALVGATILPKLRGRFSPDWIIASATVAFGIVTVSLALAANFWLLFLVMVIGGVAWVSLMSTFNVAGQTSVPAWVKARAIAVQLLVFQGGTAFGSFLWGFVAETFNLQIAFIAAGMVLAASLLTALRYRLPNEKPDFAPSKHWNEPAAHPSVEIEDGATMVTIEYVVKAENAGEFQKAMRELKRIRQRDGATFWTLMQDAAEPERWTEFYMTESWLEHRRQHERFSRADLEIEREARRFHADGEPVRVRHFVQK